MPIDIYTKQIIVTPSKEHIIPNFLGGRLRPKGLIDKSTNDAFGSGIDSALYNALHYVIVSMDARSDRKPNAPPGALRNLPGEDGHLYNVTAGGRVVSKPNLKVTVDGNKLQIVGQVPDRAALKKALRNFPPGKWQTLDRLVDEVMAHAGQRTRVSPSLKFDWTVHETDGYRAAAKIACNFLAHHDRDWFLQSEFDRIRNFVLKGPGTVPKAPPVAVVDLDTTSQGIGPLDHLVVVGPDDDGRLVGLVVYYGTLALVVNFGSDKPTAAFRHSYRVDQLGRSDRQDHPHDLSLTIPSFATAATLSYEDLQTLVVSQLSRLMQKVEDIEEGLRIRRTIQPHWDRLCDRSKQADFDEEKEFREFTAAVAKDQLEDLAPRIQAASDRRLHTAKQRLLQQADDPDCSE